MLQENNVMGDFIKDLLQKGKREDGRKAMDYRSIEIKTNVMPNAEGSAEVNIGHTRVLAGVKVGLGAPMHDKPNEGNLMTAAELLPLASRYYEPGPPTPEAIEVARVIDRGIRAANVIDMEALFVEPEKVWEVFVDIYVLNYHGNLFDAGTLAATAALKSARMPKVEKNGEEFTVIREGALGKLKTKNIVTSCTFGKLFGSVVLDPDGNEESFMDARVTIASDENVVRAMQKGLGGSFSTKELDGLLDVSFEKSRSLRNIITNAAGE
ncbi:MAG: exosome complex protein Rrp42 [Candidatus Micrarchaeota archaeon]|nr:exosome complex protein Rrp42 [Candidatus Micrarchaeota archaeon]